MGVDYISTVGYGFAIPEEEIEPLAEKLGCVPNKTML